MKTLLKNIPVPRAALLTALVVTTAAITPISASEVYMEIDENGVPVFSDTRTEGSKEIELREPQTFSSDEAIPQALPQYGAPDAEDDQPWIYSRLAVTSPANDTAIRENTGAMTISVAIAPGIKNGHKAELMMDGLAIRKLSGSGPVSLSNVDRGTHVFSVRIVDDNGKVIDEGDGVSVTMLRHAQPRRQPR